MAGLACVHRSRVSHVKKDIEETMRSVVLRGLLVAALSAMSVSPARAFGWEWLEELSGPGPWIGVQYEQKLYCHFEGAGHDLVPGMSGPCIESNVDNDSRKNWRRRVFATGLGARMSWSKDNDLPYAADRKDSSKSLTLFEINAFADVRIWRRFHAGGAFGTARFAGKPIDGAFWKPTVEARVTAKLANASIASWSGSVDLRIGRRWFLGRLEAADFGAEGPYKVDDDGVWFAGMVFDFN